MSPIVRTVDIPVGMPPSRRAILAAETYFETPMVGRKAEAVEVRLAVILALHTLPWSMSRIARALDRRPSTILQLIPRAKAAYAQDPFFAEGVDRIRAVLANR